jgi:hypothetical protein
MSSAVNGYPSLHCAFGLIVSISWVKSALYSHYSPSQGMISPVTKLA